VDVSNAICLTPPWRKPRNPVMLVNHKIEWLLLAVPALGPHDGFTASSSTYNLNSIDNLFWCASRELIGKPKHFVAPFLQSFKIGEADTFGPAGFRIGGVAPVEHQKTHEYRVCVYGGKRGL